MLEPRLCSHRSSTYRSTTELILNVKAGQTFWTFFRPTEPGAEPEFF